MLGQLQLKEQIIQVHQIEKMTEFPIQLLLMVDHKTYRDPFGHIETYCMLNFVV